MESSKFVDLLLSDITTLTTMVKPDKRKYIAPIRANCDAQLCIRDYGIKTLAEAYFQCTSKRQSDDIMAAVNSELLARGILNKQSLQLASDKEPKIYYVGLPLNIDISGIKVPPKPLPLEPTTRIVWPDKKDRTIETFLQDALYLLGLERYTILGNTYIKVWKLSQMLGEYFNVHYNSEESSELKVKMYSRLKQAYPNIKYDEFQLYGDSKPYKYVIIPAELPFSKSGKFKIVQNLLPF